MLHVLKSVADVLRQTTAIDMATASPDDQNLAMIEGSTLVVSQGDAASLPSAVLLDSRTDRPYTFPFSNTDRPYVGVTWTTEQRVDGLRLFIGLTGGNTTTHWKLQTWDGSDWNDEDGAPVTTITGLVYWVTLRLQRSAVTLGIRAIQTDAVTFAGFTITELDVRRRLDVVPRPLAWPDADRVVVCTNTTNLSAIAPDEPLVTVSAVDVMAEDGDVGNFSVAERTLVFVGLHAGSEDAVDMLRRWAQMVLETATAPNQDGATVQGIPLRAYSWPLTPTGTNSWWASGQHDWLATPAPVVRVANAVTGAVVDLGRGQVQLPGVATTADVRADFTVGAWEYDVRSAVRTVAEDVAAVQHLHTIYLALESASQFRAVDNALL